MENLVLRAENVCTIALPSKPMPSVRSGACVKLLDVSHTWGVDDEQSMIYIEHLCAADLDQHDGPWFRAEEFAGARRVCSVSKSLLGLEDVGRQSFQSCA